MQASIVSKITLVFALPAQARAHGPCDQSALERPLALRDYYFRINNKSRVHLALPKLP